MPLPWLERSRAKRWLSAAIVMCVSCALTALISRSGVPGHVRAAEENSFHETVITPSAPEVDPDSLTVAPPPCNCWKNAIDGTTPSYFLTGYAGASYFDTTTDTSGGGLGGLNFTLPIYGGFGFTSRAQVNSYSGGTQYGGTVGFYKASYAADDLMGRLGGSVLLDQFSDSGLGNPYLVQSQYNLNFALTNEWRVGVRYTDPIHGGTADVQSIIPGAAGSAPIPLVDVIEANISYRGSMLDFVQLGVGYIDAFETMTYRANISQPLSDRIAATFSTSYDEKIGRWSGFLGIQYDFSPRRSNPGLAGRSARNGGRDVVRGGSFVAMSAFSIANGGGDLGLGGASDASSDFISGMPNVPPYGDNLFDPMDYTNSIGRGISNLPVSTAPPCHCPSGSTPVGNGMCQFSGIPYSFPCGSPL